MTHQWTRLELLIIDLNKTRGLPPPPVGSDLAIICAEINDLLTKNALEPIPFGTSEEHFVPRLNQLIDTLTRTKVK